MKKSVIACLALLALLLAVSVQAAEHYVIDTAKQHAFIQFRVQHLGFSWLSGRFNRFAGTFDYDEKNVAANKVALTIDMASIDSNYAERDKHLRGEDFFDVENFPEARFKSTHYTDLGQGKGRLEGELSLHGTRKMIVIDVEQVGAGKDPWGGFRRGFEGRTTLHLSDYNLAKAAMLGPAAENVELLLSIEGIRQ